MFQNGFNKDMFNSTFENYKREQSQRDPQNSLVKYQDPEVKISMSNADSIMTLGQDKITDFSGQSDNLNYTDYKQAFTDGFLYAFSFFITKLFKCFIRSSFVNRSLAACPEPLAAKTKNSELVIVEPTRIV